MRGDRFCRLKVPDAPPGSIMMPHRALRWFRRSNCADTKARWRPARTNTYLQTQARTHSHMKSHIQRVPKKVLTNTCHLVLFVAGLQQGSSQLTFVRVKQGLNMMEQVFASPFVVKMDDRGEKTRLGRYKLKNLLLQASSPSAVIRFPGSLREGACRRTGHEPGSLCAPSRLHTRPGS